MKAPKQRYETLPHPETTEELRRLKVRYAVRYTDILDTGGNR